MRSSQLRYLVTGDGKLQRLGQFEGVHIAHQRSF
jgi:hypothetical protein